MKSTLTIACLLTCAVVQAQDSIAVTYDLGDIPTFDTIYDASCNGPSTVLMVTLPAGDNYEVTNTHVEYSMTAISPGLKEHQRSKVRCATTGLEEVEVAGIGAEPGVTAYARDISLANGTYPGGTSLVFEMWARRTSTSDEGCTTNENRVDVFSWTITVYFSDEIVNPKVGVNESTPTTTLDVGGKIRVGNDTNVPVAGTLRWHDETLDLEVFNGMYWVSLTPERAFEGWGDITTTESESDTSSDGQFDDRFGASVSISGNYAVVGALGHNGETANEGKAYLFHRVGTTWSEQDSVTASDGASNDLFGVSVSVSGDYAVVGAQSHDTDGNFNQGKAYIFKRTGMSWAEQDILTASDGASNDLFGISVSIAGDFAIVGAEDHSTGQAYIFKRNGTTWDQQTILTPSDGGLADQFGGSVCIDGDYAIVGARWHDTDGISNQGKAYIFKRTGTSWAEQAILTASDGAQGDYFGCSVAISGDYAVVGAQNHNTNGNSNQGKAYIFIRSGINWTEQDSLIAPDGGDGDHFGCSVAISGDHTIVGVPAFDIDGNLNQGKAYIFERNETTWNAGAALKSSDGSVGDNFGTAVSISGEYALIGADLGGPVDQGKVYFFKKQSN